MRLAIEDFGKVPVRLFLTPQRLAVVRDRKRLGTGRGAARATHRWLSRLRTFLVPRPRRFGKTLNLSMLSYFFARSAEDHAPLFAGLHIWEAGDLYRAHFQRYPLLALSFKGLKTDTYEACFAGIQLKDEYDEPIPSGYLSGYADQVLGFYRNFLTQGLKDNTPPTRKTLVPGLSSSSPMKWVLSEMGALRSSGRWRSARPSRCPPAAIRLTYEA